MSYRLQLQLAEKVAEAARMEAEVLRMKIMIAEEEEEEDYQLSCGYDEPLDPVAEDMFTHVEDLAPSARCPPEFISIPTEPPAKLFDLGDDGPLGPDGDLSPQSLFDPIVADPAPTAPPVAAKSASRKIRTEANKRTVAADAEIFRKFLDDKAAAKAAPPKKKAKKKKVAKPAPAPAAEEEDPADWNRENPAPADFVCPVGCKRKVGQARGEIKWLRRYPKPRPAEWPEERLICHVCYTDINSSRRAIRKALEAQELARITANAEKMGAKTTAPTKKRKAVRV